ncbi:hypothetical protein BDZ91DRAFT_724543 [Kalaharituber pfeilii]|nr:hypothetical protein BDZ91DRAFT_724543 [Kalaharituber pfeilii]
MGSGWRVVVWVTILLLQHSMAVNILLLLLLAYLALDLTTFMDLTALGSYIQLHTHPPLPVPLPILQLPLTHPRFFYSNSHEGKTRALSMRAMRRGVGTRED